MMEIGDDFSCFKTLSLNKEHDNIVASVSVNANKTEAASSGYDRR